MPRCGGRGGQPARLMTYPHDAPLHLVQRRARINEERALLSMPSLSPFEVNTLPALATWEEVRLTAGRPARPPWAQCSVQACAELVLYPSLVTLVEQFNALALIVSYEQQPHRRTLFLSALLACLLR
jgi:hypothetical protein